MDNTTVFKDNVINARVYVDRKALEALFVEWEYKPQGDWTTASFEVLNTARINARKYTQWGEYKDTATQEEIDKALKELQAAIDALEKLADTEDKADLQALYDDNKDTELGNYTQDSFTTLQTALAAANEVLKNTDASVPQVETAETALQAAIEGLTKNTVDASALQKLYVDNKDKEQGNYTNASFATLQEALAVAKTVLDKHTPNNDATQAEVDAAKTALEAAVAGLLERGDKTKLQALYNEWLAKDEDAYTSTSYKALKDALDAAKAVLDDIDALQPAIDAAKAALDTAVAGMVMRGDKTDLKALYDEWLAKDEDAYTSASYEALKDALDAAKAVLDDIDALQEEIDTAKTALQTAADGLVERGDKTDLQALYDECSATAEAAYTAESYQALKEALDAAKAVLDDIDALQPAIDAAKAALDTAVAGLVERGDKTDLQALYNEWSAKDEAAYTAESYQALKEALDAAKTVLDNVDATKTDVDMAKEALQKAIDGLVEISTDEPSGDNNDNPSTQDPSDNNDDPATQNPSDNNNGKPGGNTPATGDALALAPLALLTLLCGGAVMAMRKKNA